VDRHAGRHVDGRVGAPHATVPTPWHARCVGSRGSMVMLSELRLHHILDQHAHRARLVDLAVDLSAGDYPRVTRLLFSGPRNRPMQLEWDANVTVEWKTRRVRVANITSGRGAPADSLRNTVLLRRDVLDAMLLDVAHRQTMRANDLWLEPDGNDLWLCAADISPWAVFRRLGRGWLGHTAKGRMVDWRDVEFLRGDPRAALEGGDYHRRIARLPAPAIARLAEDLPYRHSAELLTLIPDPLAADTLEAMLPERQLQVFDTLDRDQAVRLLALMAPDLAADLIGHLDQDAATAFLNRLPQPAAERIIDLLRYPEDTAGGIMTNDVPMVPRTTSVRDARTVLHDQIATPDFVYYVYVVDEIHSRALQGVITLRDLLVRDEDRRVDAFMRRDIVAIDALEPAHVAARRVVDEHLAALPVVSRDGRLLGSITVDAAVALVTPVSWRDQVPRVFS
jgi:magnesium transporter